MHFPLLLIGFCIGIKIRVPDGRHQNFRQDHQKSINKKNS